MRINHEYVKNIGISNSRTLKHKFADTFTFCNGHLNKFILLLRKRVYPYKYNNSWIKFDENSLANRETFYSKLNFEDSKPNYKQALK